MAAMTVNGFYDKFPDEIVQFNFDASDILLNGDTIQSVVGVSFTTGFTVSNVTFVGSIISFRVSGGTAGEVAYGAVKATLVSGQLREGSLTVLIKPLPGA
jgi:hypothetical protein